MVDVEDMVGKTFKLNNNFYTVETAKQLKEQPYVVVNEDLCILNLEEAWKIAKSAVVQEGQAV